MHYGTVYVHLILLIIIENHSNIRKNLTPFTRIGKLALTDSWNDDTRNVLDNHRSKWEKRVSLENGLWNALVHCDPKTSDSNVCYSVNSTNRGKWWPHPEIKHNLRYDWRLLEYYVPVYRLSRLQYMFEWVYSYTIPKGRPMNPSQTIANTITKWIMNHY